MAKHDKIRSTEKLLEVIRNRPQSETSSDTVSSTVTISEAKQRPLVRAITLQKKYTIGVDIGHTYVKMAKIVQTSDKSSELLDYIDMPLNAQISLKDPNFLERLKTTLEQFIGDTSRFDIWSAIPSAQVETRCIRIPKLPRKQIPNAIFWTFTKKVEFDENNEILDYEILGDVTEGGVKKTEVMTFKAPKSEIAALKEAFVKIGYPLKGISIVPFAIQNLFRAKVISPEEDDICCLFVGRDWSRIAIFSNGDLVLSRGIKAGMRSMVEAINIAIQRQEGWSQQRGAQSSADTAAADSTPAILPAAQKIFFDFIGVHQTTHPSKSDDQSVDPPQVFQMVLPAMERLIRQVERTFEHYALNFNRKGVKRIYLSGQVTANATVVDYIGRQLDMPIVVMNPFVSGAFVHRVNIPESQDAREGFVPAIGLALANNKITPNVLFTHKDKNQVESVRRVNMRVLTGCMLCLIILIGIFSWQEKRLDIKRQQLDKLNQQLLTYSPQAKKDILLALYAKAKRKREAVHQIAQRFAPVAVVNELSQITPASVRLLSIDAAFSSEPAKASEATGTITLDGVIFGDADGFETTLTGYLLALKNSPVFRKPNVQSKKVEYYNNQEVLRFNAKLEII